MFIVALLLALALIIAFIFPRIAERRVLGKREALPDDQLARSFNSTSLPAKTVVEILKLVGTSYGISYSKLKPADCFISQLGKIDSWRFDAGAEKLERVLMEKFEVSVPAGASAFTVLDLMKLVEANATRK